MQHIEQIRLIAREQGTREAIVPAVLYLLTQGQSPTGHAVYKLLAQGSQTTINDQIKVAYSSIGNALSPMLQGDAGQAANMAVLFNSFLSLFDMATKAADSAWSTEKTAVMEELNRLNTANAELSAERMDLATKLQQALKDLAGTQEDLAHQVEITTGVQRKLADSEAAIARATLDQEATAARLAAARADLESSRLESADLRRRINEDAIKLQAALVATDAATKRVEQQQAESVALNGRLNLLETDLLAQKEMLQKAEHACQEAVSENDRLRLAATTAQAHNTELSADLQIATARIEELSAANKTANAMHLAAQEQITGLKEEIAGCRAVNAALQGVIEKLSSVPAKGVG